MNKPEWLQFNVVLNFALHAILALMLEITLKRYSIWLMS